MWRMQFKTLVLVACSQVGPTLFPNHICARHLPERSDQLTPLYLEDPRYCRRACGCAPLALGRLRCWVPALPVAACWDWAALDMWRCRALRRLPIAGIPIASGPCAASGLGPAAANSACCPKLCAQLLPTTAPELSLESDGPPSAMPACMSIDQACCHVNVLIMDYFLLTAGGCLLLPAALYTY